MLHLVLLASCEFYATPHSTHCVTPLFFNHPLSAVSQPTPNCVLNAAGGCARGCTSWPRKGTGKTSTSEWCAVRTWKRMRSSFPRAGLLKTSDWGRVCECLLCSFAMHCSFKRCCLGQTWSNAGQTPAASSLAARLTWEVTTPPSSPPHASVLYCQVRTPVLPCKVCVLLCDGCAIRPLGAFGACVPSACRW